MLIKDMVSKLCNINRIFISNHIMAFKGFDNGAQKCNKRIPNDGMYRRLLSLGDRATTDELLELLKPLKEYPIHTLHFIDMIKFYDWVVEIDYEKQRQKMVY